MRKNDIIIVRIWEGLGNQLFQYAYARSLKEKGHDVRLDLNKAYDDTFFKYEKNDLRQNSIQKFNISLPAINVEKYGKYDYIKRDNNRDRIIYFLAKYGLWRYKFHEAVVQYYTKKSANIRGNYYVKGWFQDERYFKELRTELLKELVPKRKIRISKKLRQALEYEESVSLHVRRGDYVKIRNTLDVTYFRKAITWMKQQYHNPLFLIFSEDLDWVRRNLEIGDNCIYVNENRELADYEELMIMSRCKSNIISNSTYSWWGAWLNRNPEKIIIAPRYGWRPNQKNIVPEEWIML